MLLLHDPQGAEPLLAEVATVPGERHSFGFGVAALLLVREPRDNDVRGAALARSMFKLTQAETAVVADLVAGLGPQAIADRAQCERRHHPQPYPPHLRQGRRAQPGRVAEPDHRAALRAGQSGAFPAKWPGGDSAPSNRN
jgi:hypothetical protein